jgi:hypothetical protein
MVILPAIVIGLMIHHLKDRDPIGQGAAHFREHRQAAGKRKTVLPITSCWRFLLIISTIE